MVVEVKWGADQVKWGERDVAFGGAQDLLVSDSTVLAHAVTAEYLDGTVLAAWTGLGEITVGGQTYTGVGPKLLRVEPMRHSLSSGQGNLRIVLSAIEPEHRALFTTDPGRVQVTVRFLVSTDGGNSFTELPRSVTGELSRPVLQGGEYNFEISSYIDSLDRGYRRVWSDESQEALVPGDKGLEHLRALSAGLDIRWP